MSQYEFWDEWKRAQLQGSWLYEGFRDAMLSRMPGYYRMGRAARLVARREAFAALSEQYKIQIEAEPYE